MNIRLLGVQALKKRIERFRKIEIFISGTVK